MEKEAEEKMKKDKFVDRFNKRLSMINMSAAQLSRSTGISEAVISQYRSGKYEPKQDRFETFAIALNVSEAWLMGFDVPMEREPFDKTKELNEKILFLLDKLSPEQKMLLIAQMKGIIAAAEEKK